MLEAAQSLAAFMAKYLPATRKRFPKKPERTEKPKAKA